VELGYASGLPLECRISDEGLEDLALRRERTARDVEVLGASRELETDGRDDEWRGQGRD
jgi:hypothetical protein